MWSVGSIQEKNISQFVCFLIHNMLYSINSMKLNDHWNEIDTLFYLQRDMLSFFPSGQDDSLLYSSNSTFNDKIIECLRYKLEIIEESMSLDDSIKQIISAEKSIFFFLC